MAGTTALVVGATGAVGEQVVGWLLTSGKWDKVVTVGRRKLTVPDSFRNEDYKAALEQVEVNMDNLKGEAASAFSAASAVFCCLGTTRAVAGSADQFIKVDLEYVRAAAEAAKAGGATKHFSLLTAGGANPNLWANHWRIFHPLLYTRTKGQAEEAVKAQGFASLSIFRPGLIERGAHTRGVERSIAALVSSIPASGLAKLMVQDAEAALAANRSSAVAVYEMSELKRALKEGLAPRA